MSAGDTLWPTHLQLLVRSSQIIDRRKEQFSFASSAKSLPPLASLQPEDGDDIPRLFDELRSDLLAARIHKVFVNRAREGTGDVSMSTPAFRDSPPLTERVNAYDEAYLATYLRLLDAAEEGADWREAVRIIFGLDVAADPERARRIHDSHLARARWMTETGYRHLLQSRMQ